MNEKEKIYTHPSYATITSSRISRGKNHALFGSSLKTNHPIRIQIQPAELHRDLNHDWIHSHRLPFIEIEMSEGQWAQFVSSMNVGDGTPCTVKFLHGKPVEEPPFLNKVVEFQDEFKDSMNKITNDMRKLVKDTVEMLETKKNINKTDREIMLKQVEGLILSIKSSLPFIAESFGDQMEKVIEDAKHQINTHYNNVIVKTGISEIAKLQSMDVPQIVEGNKNAKE